MLIAMLWDTYPASSFVAESLGNSPNDYRQDYQVEEWKSPQAYLFDF